MLSTGSRASQQSAAAGGGILRYFDFRLLVATIITIIIIIIIHNRHQFDVQPNREQVFTEEKKEQLTQDELKQYKTVEVMGKNVKYLEAISESGNNKVLFLMLHGAKFNAMTWKKETNSLQYLSQKGHRVVAVDIPGFGQSMDEGIVSAPSRGEFLKKLIQKVVSSDQEKVVLVTPSMSGDYVLRFLNEDGTGIAAWVPVAPVGVSQWSGPAETALQIKVLAIYGELDPLKKDIERLKSFFPAENFQSTIIKEAPHPAYLKDPALFNTKLDELAKKIS